MNKHTTILLAAVSLYVAVPVTSFAQVFGSGPSDPSLFTNGVFNVPEDTAPSRLGRLQQLNVTDGGSAGGFNFETSRDSEVNVSGGRLDGIISNFGNELNISGGEVNSIRAFSGSQVNISGGDLISGFEANSGSQVNISGGNIFETTNAEAGSEVNISGGVFGNLFQSSSGSVVNISGGTLFESNFVGLVNISDRAILNDVRVNSTSETNISGGTIGKGFTARSGSRVSISGGTVGDDFNADSGSDVELIGGEFRLNNAVYTEPTVTLNSGDVFTGTLSDGSTFIFGQQASDLLNAVTLTSASLTTIDLTPIVVTTPVTEGPNGLRAGQTLTLEDGGVLRDNFAVVGGTLNITAGDAGQGVEASNSQVNISGGNVGSDFAAFSGSVVNISGGTFGFFQQRFNAYSGSVVNISGGDVGNFFSANSGSVVNISDGEVGTQFDANSGSVVNISGGTVGVGFDANSGSVVNISGGTVEFGFDARSGSQVNISGGTFADVEAFSGSVVNISGGIIENSFEARSGSAVDLIGIEFLLDGEHLELAVGDTLTITERNMTLSGLLADGSAFSFDLNTSQSRFNDDLFDRDATLTVTRVSSVPEPSGLVLLVSGSLLLCLRRSRI